jgi:hypothetical protein
MYDYVEFIDTADEYLDGSNGIIMGRHEDEYVIVVFLEIPQGFFPAIVISENCLRHYNKKEVSFL